MRDAAGELDHLDAALHRAHRIGQRLAVLLGDDARELLLVRLQELQEFLHDARAAQRRRVAPLGECRGCRFHRGIDDPGVGKGHAFRHLAGGGIEHLAVATGGTDRLTVNPERNGIESQLGGLIH